MYRNRMVRAVKLRFETIANLVLITDELSKLQDLAERHNGEMRALYLECKTAKAEQYSTLAEVSRLNGKRCALMFCPTRVTNFIFNYRGVDQAAKDRKASRQ